jgi:hypothetical protein
MAELSFLARLVLTLLLLALSLVAYKWLQPPPTNSSTKAPPKRVKRRSKKKAAKKANPPSPPSQTPKVPAAAPAAAPTISVNNDVSDSDSDDGLSAAQVLASRKFQPKSLGGTRLARKIKASLPPAGAPRFEVDQPVLAKFEGGERWFKATVLEQRKGNEYHLKYEDGEVEYRVPAEFIKLRPTKREDDEDSDGSGEAQVSEVEKPAVEQAVGQEVLSDSDLSESDDDDGWQVVGTSTVAKRHAKRAQAAAPAAEVLVDGLTKRQRENRRKKERQREKKEMLRQHAQEGEFDARNRWRYAPS